MKLVDYCESCIYDEDRDLCYDCILMTSKDIDKPFKYIEK